MNPIHNQPVKSRKRIPRAATTRPAPIKATPANALCSMVGKPQINSAMPTTKQITPATPKPKINPKTVASKPTSTPKMEARSPSHTGLNRIAPKIARIISTIL